MSSVKVGTTKGPWTNNVGAIKRQNKKSLVEILGAKNPIEFYVIKQSIDYYDLEDENSDERYYAMEGLIIYDGDIENPWNYAFHLYEDGSIWIGANLCTCEDEFKLFFDNYEDEFLDKFLKENKIKRK